MTTSASIALLRRFERALARRAGFDGLGERFTALDVRLDATRHRREHVAVGLQVRFARKRPVPRNDAGALAGERQAAIDRRDHAVDASGARAVDERIELVEKR